MLSDRITLTFASMSETQTAVSTLLALLVVSVVVLAFAVGLWWRFFRLRVTWATTLYGVRIELFEAPPTYLKRVPGGALLVPVGSDAWIGRCMTKIVRDHGGDVIQEELHRGGTLSVGAVRVVTGGKLKVRHVIAYRMYDDQNRANLSLAATALDAAIGEARKLGARDLVFIDFSPAFSYSRDRHDGGFSARVVLDAVQRHRQGLRAVRVFVPDHRSYVQWRSEIRSAVAAPIGAVEGTAPV